MHVQYGSKVMEIMTDHLQPLGTVKEKTQATWCVPREQQHLYSDGLELTGDDKILWSVAVENVTATLRPNILKAMEKIKDWKITVTKEFKPIEAKDIPNKHRIPWKTEKVVETLNEKGKVIFELSTEERILEDNCDTSRMVLSSKKGQWDQVLKILQRKPYIVNAIPQERAWSALHQAVYHNDTVVVGKLLAVKTCDTVIKAKRDQNNQGKDGMTPYQLAMKLKSDCESLLLDNRTNNSKSLDITFIPTAKGTAFLTTGIPYYDFASSFLRHNILSSMKLENGSFLYITEKMFQLLEKDWKYVQSTVTECLYPFDKMIADELQEATSSDELKKKMIWIYTCNAVYKQVNAALRRASNTEYPVSDDLLLSLYSMFLTSILLHWNDLTRETVTTYRGVSLTIDQAELYKEGTTFHWLSLTSSSREKKVTEYFSRKIESLVSALFVINNSHQSKWSPRDIKSISTFEGEQELIHPPFAKFRITEVKEVSEHTEYALELLQAQ